MQIDWTFCLSLIIIVSFFLFSFSLLYLIEEKKGKCCWIFISPFLFFFFTDKTFSMVNSWLVVANIISECRISWRHLPQLFALYIYIYIQNKMALKLITELWYNYTTIRPAEKQYTEIKHQLKTIILIYKRMYNSITLSTFVHRIKNLGNTYNLAV